MGYTIYKARVVRWLVLKSAVEQMIVPEFIQGLSHLLSPRMLENNL